MSFFNTVRRAMYRSASLMGDAKAVSKGSILPRILRKEATKRASRVINKLFK